LRKKEQEMTKLSARIKKKMANCPICHGKLSYWKKFYDVRMKLSCNECSDWCVAVRGIKKLERAVKAASDLNEAIKNKNNIIDMFNKRVKLDRVLALLKEGRK
jgi:hypothetical protein